MVLYHGRVKNKFAPNKISSSMTTKAVKSSKTNENSFVLGSGVTSSNASNRSALKRRAIDSKQCACINN
jgi:hypothetical protein